MTDNVTGKMTLIDTSGIKIWNGKREVDHDGLKKSVERANSIVSIKAGFRQEHLRPFRKLKQRIRRVLEDEGYSFLSGFAVPVHRTEHVLGRIEKYISEANQARDHFLSHYDEWRDQILEEAEDDEWRRVLDEAMLTREQVAERINFDVVPLNVTVSQADPSGLERKVGTLREEIVSNAAKVAQEFVDKNQVPDNMSRRACGKLKELKRKIEGFNWLHNVRSGGVATLLDHAIAAANACTEPTLPESVYWQVIGPIMVIADRDRLQKYLDGEIDLQAIQNSGKVEQVEQKDDSEPAVLDDEAGFDFGALVEQPSESVVEDLESSEDIDFMHDEAFPAEETQDLSDLQFDDQNGFVF